MPRFSPILLKIIILVSILFLYQTSNAIELNNSHMRVHIPNIPIQSITTRPTRVGITTKDNRLFMFFMSRLDSPTIQNLAGFPKDLAPYDKKFLPTWKQNIETTIENAVYVQTFPNQNGIIVILSSKDYGHYIWCDYIRNGYVFSITAPGTSSLDESINQAFLLFNSIDYVDYGLF